MTKYRFFITVLILATLTGCVSTKLPRPGKNLHEEINFRLQEDVVPQSYDLTLWLENDHENFSGQVTIDLELFKPRAKFLIHGKDLKVHSANLLAGNVELLGKYEQISPDGMALVSFETEVLPGHYQLKINYSASYQKDLKGLYRAEEGGEFYLYTQFEPLSARTMLPCFDEPQFKTPFNVTVVSNQKNHVIANAPLAEKILEGQNAVHRFLPTKPLPTYLLAIALGPFDIVEGPELSGQNKKKIQFRGIAVKGKGHKLSYAMRKTPEILHRLEKYFGSSYPFQKLDILAVPDFSAGAMENVGAVTFREWYLLLDEANASVDQIRSFYLIMAHELAHMWFGNLVTMKWWDDLWLNEAFATWMSYKIVDEIQPDFKTQIRLLSRSQNVMAQDSLKSARKIREPINSSHDIVNAFDGITYSKGGALLGMLENFIGKNKFQKAVQDHLKRFSFSSASAEDFLQSLAKFSSEEAVFSAKSFLNQTGVPQIHLSYGCTERGFRIFVEQKQFSPTKTLKTSERIWNVPMCIGYESSGGVKKQCFILDKPANYLDFDGENCPQFVLPNLEGKGYYRFSMSSDDWRNLLDAPSHLLDESSKIAMADSLRGELYAGQLDYGFVLEGQRSLLSESSSSLAAIFTAILRESAKYWVDESLTQELQKYAGAALKPFYQRLKENSSLSQDQKRLKKNLQKFLVHTAKDNESRLELSVMGGRYLRSILKNEVGEISVDQESLREAIAIGLEIESHENLDKAINVFSQMSDPTMRSNFLYGLAKSRSGKDAQSIRELVFKNIFRQNEVFGFLNHHLENPLNQPATWDFLKNNYDRFKENLSKSQQARLPYLAQGLCSYDDAESLEKFFENNIQDLPGGPRNLNKVIEQIKICAARKIHTANLARNYFMANKEQQVAGN